MLSFGICTAGELGGLGLLCLGGLLLLGLLLALLQLGDLLCADRLGLDLVVLCLPLCRLLILLKCGKDNKQDVIAPKLDRMEAKTKQSCQSTTG